MVKQRLGIFLIGYALGGVQFYTLGGRLNWDAFDIIMFTVGCTLIGLGLLVKAFQDAKGGSRD